MSLPPGFLDELQSRLSLSQVVGRKVMWDTRKSNQAKGDMWAPCPFHQEKTASFHVDGRKGFYYCFGCHAKGDAISFLKEIHGLSFDEAVFALASRTECELSFERAQGKGINLDDLVDVKDFIVENFTQENFLELGIKTGWSEFINSHPRLLRSLSWGDPDYPSCVMELISRMQSRNDGSIEKIHEY